MPFAESFIQGALAGQQVREARRRQQQEQEDRKIEQQLLQHRIRELKIQDQLRARQLALEDVKLLEGQSEADLAASAFEPGSIGGRVESAGPTAGTTEPTLPGQVESLGGLLPTLMRAVQVPGVSELGRPGLAVRPRSLEQLRALQVAQKRAEEAERLFPVGPGTTVVRGTGEVVARGAPRPERQVPVTTRDRSGRETTRFVPESAVAGQEFVKEPRPRADQDRLIAVTTRDAEGQEVTRYLPESEVKGKTFVKEPTTTKGKKPSVRVRLDASTGLQVIEVTDPTSGFSGQFTRDDIKALLPQHGIPADDATVNRIIRDAPALLRLLQ